MPTILLTAPVAARRLYYGDDALAGLRSLADVRLNESEDAYSVSALVERARDCEIIVCDRQTSVPSDVFAALVHLRAVVRCTVDIRNIDVGAASKHGMLVTRASPGFAASVSELVIGFMIDLARGVTSSSLSYRQGDKPVVGMGRQLARSSVGIVGFGEIGRALAARCSALGMAILVMTLLSIMCRPNSRTWRWTISFVVPILSFVLLSLMRRRSVCLMRLHSRACALTRFSLMSVAAILWMTTLLSKRSPLN